MSRAKSVLLVGLNGQLTKHFTKEFGLYYHLAVVDADADASHLLKHRFFEVVVVQGDVPEKQNIKRIADFASHLNGATFIVLTKQAEALKAAPFYFKENRCIYSSSISGAQELNATIEMAFDSSRLNASRPNDNAEEVRGLLQNIMQHESAEIWVKDREGNFIIANASFAQKREMEASDVVGKNDQDIEKSRFTAAFLNSDKEVLKCGKAIAYTQVEELDQQTIKYSIKKFPLFDSNKNIYAVGGIATKIHVSDEKDINKTPDLNGGKVNDIAIKLQQTARSLEIKREQSKFISNLLSNISSNLTLDGLFQSSLKMLLMHLGWGYAEVYRKKENTFNTLEPYLQIHNPDAFDFGNRIDEKMPKQQRLDIVHKAQQTRKGAFRLGSFNSQCHDDSFISYSIPIVMDNKVDYVLVMYCFLEASESSHVAEVAKEFAMHLSTAVQRVKLIERLNETRSQFQEFSETLPLSVIMLDKQGQILNVNKQGRNMLDPSGTMDLCTYNLKHFISVDNLEIVVKAFEDKKAGKKVASVDYEVVNSRGKVFNVLAYGSNVFKRGKLVGMRTVWVDVTHLKEMNHKVQKQRNDLDTYNKAMVSRELRLIELKKEIRQMEKQLQEKSY